MKILSKSKDGGAESHVWGYWLIEIKSLFTIALLRFDPGTREAFHNHAFNCISWVLKGKLEERHLNGAETQYYTPSIFPIITKRETFHQVFSHGTTWVFTLRGPWSKTWKEQIGDKEITLTNGRQIVDGSI